MEVLAGNGEGVVITGLSDVEVATEVIVVDGFNETLLLLMCVVDDAVLVVCVVEEAALVLWEVTVDVVVDGENTSEGHVWLIAD